MKERTKQLLTSVVFIATFIAWTVALRYVDVRPIGPNGTLVGFAAFNGFVHRLTGVCMPIYIITDWLGLVPVAIGFSFSALGLIQWIRRKHILRVDWSILMLGIFYLLMLVVYLLFESLVINYRPVLINGYLEASYPSSTTLLTLCVIPTTMWQLHRRIKRSIVRHLIQTILTLFMLFMVVGRLLAGVHWITDIVGGILLSIGMFLLYDAVCGLKD